MKEFESVILLIDLNEIIKKGMIGAILEVWDDEAVEVEFVKDDGTNYEYEGQTTFAINKKNLEILK